MYPTFFHVFTCFVVSILAFEKEKPKAMKKKFVNLLCCKIGFRVLQKKSGMFEAVVLIAQERQPSHQEFRIPTPSGWPVDLVWCLIQKRMTLRLKGDHQRPLHIAWGHAFNVLWERRRQNSFVKPRTHVNLWRPSNALLWSRISKGPLTTSNVLHDWLGGQL